jgi:hypothetical protein
MLSGKHTMHNETTGVDEVRTAGWTNVKDQANVGVYSITVDEDSSHLCFTSGESSGNSDVLPELNAFYLAAGESTILPKNTKLYLGRGALDIEGVAVEEMRQIRVSSDSKRVTAVTECHGWLFK